MVSATTLLTGKNIGHKNSGVMAEGTHDGESIEFYGCLKQIIELQYNSSEWITPLQWFFFVVTGLILTARNVE